MAESKSNEPQPTKAGLVFCSVPIEDFNRAQLQLSLPDCVAALERMLKQDHKYTSIDPPA